MSLDKAVEKLGEAEEHLRDADADEDAIDIVDRVRHQLEDCRLSADGSIDSSGHLYKGVRRCSYRDR